jgi:hypothetical protein
MSIADDARRNADRIVNGRLDRVGRAVGFELLGRLIRVTPVDEGRARGNWNASIGAEDGTDNPERREQQALSEGSTKIAPLRLSKQGEKLYLTNGVPYIGRLNDGYSKQAPAAFIQTTVADMRAFVDRMAQQENLRG